MHERKIFLFYMNAFYIVRTEREAVNFPGIRQSHCFLCLRSLDSHTGSLQANSDGGRDGSKVGEEIGMVPPKVVASKDETSED